MAAPERCPDTGCMDDICHGSQQCMMTGYPLAQRCTICGEATIPELDEMCACERSERDFEQGYDPDDEQAYYRATEEEDGG